MSTWSSLCKPSDLQYSMSSLPSASMFVHIMCRPRKIPTAYGCCPAVAKIGTITCAAIAMLTSSSGVALGGACGIGHDCAISLTRSRRGMIKYMMK